MAKPQKPTDPLDALAATIAAYVRAALADPTKRAHLVTRVAERVLDELVAERVRARLKD